MNEHQRNIVFSTGTSEYETPRWLFDELHKVFNFTLDPCASDLSHMTAHYFTEKNDGLVQDWGNKNVYINPPYSDCDVWVEAAKYHYLENSGVDSVVLIPARTDTRYWHDHIWNGAQFVLFIKGRLKFINRMHPSYQFTKSWIEEAAHGYDWVHMYDHGNWVKQFAEQYRGAVNREWKNMPSKEDILNATKKYSNGVSIHEATESIIHISSAPFPSAVVMYTDRFLGSEFDHIGKLVELV